MIDREVLGILGFGNLGQAILRGLLQKGTAARDRLVVYDVDAAKTQEAARLGVERAASAAELARRSTVVVLAVKPQTIQEALSRLKPGASPETLVISIAAGISIHYIQEQLGRAFRVVRVMPNTPALVGAGAAGMTLSSNCSPRDGDVARAIFEAVGTVEMVAEEAMDAVTALSGSGPAYFLYMMECLARAAVAQGLDEAQAARLARQTLVGAGRLLAESGEAPEVLRARVTSKGGTTEAALARLEALGFESVVREAVAAATARSRELGKEIGSGLPRQK
jgi:pyrroline-5-carboxylate reductase